jgi:hypothetical protein
MPYLTESTPPVFPTQVWELTTDDDVLGGPGGTSNRPQAELTERTNWLKYYLGLAQNAIVALQSSLVALAIRVTSIEAVIAAVNATNSAPILISRLDPALRNSITTQSVTVRPTDVAFNIDFDLGGIVQVELQNTAPCAFSFANARVGQAGEIYFTSIFGQARVAQMPAASPRFEVAAPDTRTLTTDTVPRGLAYRVLPSGLIRATFIRDFA